MLDIRRFYAVDFHAQALYALSIIHQYFFMKNVNYNVIKLLHNQLDDLWRIEKHYQKDAKKSKCGCTKLLAAMRADMKKNITLLKAELAAHYKTDKLA
ncbi:hypothetical protein KKF59_01375 [Patescibacteria group bacterium]|nr:hypothetical protein [Patescibacteria group bacterium]MBU1907765.1 hypothetical protein [Patescibacteria group bacterium]